MKNLGFTDYFVSIYVTLLKHKELDARRLSELPNVPYSRVYEVLNEMIEKGVIIKIDGRPSTYSATTPREMLTSLQANQNQFFEQNARVIRPYLESLFGPEKSAVETSLSIIYGNNAICARLTNVIKSTAQSLSLAIADLEAYFPPISTELERLKARNVHITVIVDDSQKGTPNFNQISSLVSVKTSPDLLGTFAIADGINVLIISPKATQGSTHTPLEVIGLSSSHSSVAYVFQAIFQKIIEK
ncbi:MAG: sugar-specific transcriptional regulator, TrmB family [Promethearchaeota archaeon CR_4]|nr:MAG: sugar-specific transcriptional regulator, TrmB family [Candidatus Lokiarchaeota archaeon CR_4]